MSTRPIAVGTVLPDSPLSDQRLKSATVVVSWLVAVADLFHYDYEVTGG